MHGFLVNLVVRSTAYIVDHLGTKARAFTVHAGYARTYTAQTFSLDDRSRRRSRQKIVLITNNTGYDQYALRVEPRAFGYS